MTEPPRDGGLEQPDGTGSSDPGSPDYAGSPDDGPRRGAHRAGARPTPPPPPPAGAPYWPTPPDAPPGEKLKQPLADTLPVRLLQAGAAIAAIGVVVLLLYLVFHNDKTEKDNTGAGATSTAPATPGGRPTSGAATTTGGTATSAAPTTSAASTTTKGATAKPPAGKPTAKPTTKPATKPTSKPTTSPAAKPTTAAPQPAAVKAPLLVLNNSRIHGLATTGAATFRAGGWTVVGTGNYGGRLPQTTVFYSPGFKAAAETLARQFPSVTTVEPRRTGIPGDALTVVLTRYFKP